MITTWALPSQRLRICSRHLDPQQSYWPIENYSTDRISLLCQQAQGRAKSVTVEQDVGLSVKDIASCTGISEGCVQTILKKRLDLRKVCARWVPHLLTEEQKT